MSTRPDKRPPNSFVFGERCFSDHHVLTWWDGVGSFSDVGWVVSSVRVYITSVFLTPALESFALSQRRFGGKRVIN